MDIKEVQEQILENNHWYVGSQFEWAEREEIKRLYSYRERLFNSVIDKFSDEKINFLDAGCGDGYWLKRMSKNNKIKLHAVEYNHLRVDRVKSMMGDSVKIYHSDLMTFEPNEKYDIILFNQVIEHIEDDKGILKKLVGLLKNDGVLILGTPNEGCYLLQNYLKKYDLLKSTDHVHFYKEENILSVIKSANLEVVKIMREPFFFFNEDWFYWMMRTKFRYNILRLITKLFPSQCSDYYFVCRLKK